MLDFALLILVVSSTICALIILQVLLYETTTFPPAYTLHVQNPWFNQILCGAKTVEGRVGDRYKYPMIEGNIICIRNGDAITYVRVNKVQHYRTLAEYLSVHWQQAAPHAKDFEDAKRLYLDVCTCSPYVYQVFSEERVIMSGGILAFTISNKL